MVGMHFFRAQSGFTYLAALFAVAIMGVALAAAGAVWHTAQQREKERELLFVGNQFRTAIGLYYERSPGTVKRYPASLKELLKDERHLSTQRYLRKIFIDPMTGKPGWSLVTAPEGGIMGVYSLSDATPLKTGSFRHADRALEGKSRYSEWKFAYEPAAQPTAATPDSAHAKKISVDNPGKL